jgi:hypothetical protein
MMAVELEVFPPSLLLLLPPLFPAVTVTMAVTVTVSVGAQAAVVDQGCQSLPPPLMTVTILVGIAVT